MTERKKPQIKKVELVAHTQIFRVESVDLEFSNGEQRVYERLLTRRPAVLIVPVVDNNLILISEYSVGLEKYELTFPKGLIDAGESVLEAAERELREETGYAAKSLTELRSLSLAPGYMMHQTHIVLAQQLYDSPLTGDEPEPLEVRHWPLADVDKLLEHPDFSEGRSMAALWLALHKLKQEAS